MVIYMNEYGFSYKDLIREDVELLDKIDLSEIIMESDNIDEIINYIEKDQSLRYMNIHDLMDYIDKKYDVKFVKKISYKIYR